MNFYTLAAKMRKEISRERDRFERQGLDFDEAIAKAKDNALNTFEANTRLGIELMMRYKKIADEMGLYENNATRTFMITIRPENNKITFQEFYELIAKYTNRTCFENFALTFEQKGTSDETLGHGFHVHIVAKMKQRSKKEVLRDTFSTFKSCTAEHCIQVDVCKNPEATIKNYLIEYNSSDNHKIVTKEWDQKWRLKEDIKSIYNNVVPGKNKELSVPYQVHSGTQIVELE